MNINEVLKQLPHRFPFLLIDRVVEYKTGESLIAQKNVTINEPFFTGHFPELPVMPGVLILESLAQACGLLIFLTTGLTKDQGIYYYAGIDNVRFRRIVIPGDRLEITVKVERNKLNVWKFNAKATVDGEVACTADITLAK
jgi:3-hydroxyacyl-[acyl-carrier-protein] dehydratase